VPEIGWEHKVYNRQQRRLFDRQIRKLIERAGAAKARRQAGAA
jgi:hypothetical protein